MKNGIVFSFLIAACCGPVWGGLKIEFSYEFDSSGFFDVPVRREMLEVAAGVVNKYVDNLAEIAPTDENTWDAFFSRPDGSGDEILTSLFVPQDTIVIYVAGRELGVRNLAHAIELGAVGNGSQEFKDLVQARGQLGAFERSATDVGTLGGTITFNHEPTQVDWHFGRSTRRLEAHEHDFITVAAHEILHLLGIGTAKSWRDNINRFGEFSGPEVAAASRGGFKPRATDDHWVQNTFSTWNGNRQELLLVPELPSGERMFPTVIDRAAMRDIGWEEASAGDANLDRVFNSTDLVSMFQANQFETNTLAFWAEGDFNDDAKFNSTDLVVALETGTYVNAATAASRQTLGDEQRNVKLFYNTTTGDFYVESSEPLSSLELTSDQNQFRADVWNPTGVFDVARTDKLFHMNVNGFSDLSFGSVLTGDLDLLDLNSDLNIDGSFLVGGRLENVQLVAVPEPTAHAFTLLVAVAMLHLCRRRVVRI